MTTEAKREANRLAAAAHRERIGRDEVNRRAAVYLCKQCNSALGLLEDSSQLLQSAAEYLRRHGS